MKVAIAGYGSEGKVSYRYWREQGHDVVIVDERDIQDELPGDAKTLLGQGVFDQLTDFDLVVRTPSLSPAKIHSSNIWSATNEFFAACPASIIGVTGTKGKGTTSSLIASILKAAGRTVHLVGNIGVPALEVLTKIKPDDIVVFELSSFQLWDLQVSPHVAVVLMIEPDHLDVHADFEDYVMAKANIVTHQSADDTVIFSPENADSARIAGQSKGTKIPYTQAPGAYVQGDFFWYNEQKVCSTSHLKLPGKHNLENAAAAITAVWPYVQDGTVISEGLATFAGLPHRLKLVDEIEGVRYYDDSIATTPGSAIAALRSFDEPKVIILGGSDKGADYRGLVSVCAETGARVLAIGQTGRNIADLCAGQGVSAEYSSAQDMQEIVRQSQTLASGAGVVILSPASASFDMFKNYADRGDQFITAVASLKAGSVAEQ